jgi:hypothetical protein
MSRLARSETDWCQLLELCALSGALLADVDGVYDPAEYNDRMLLGLKGTMSAAELHLIKQRMYAGRINKARRGELAFPLPVGYVRRPSGEVAFDPDEQVQTVVRLVFSKFTEIGSLNGLLRWLVEHQVQMGVRLRCGPGKGDLEWRRPNRVTLQNMLHNPVYAGIYAYGRRRVDPRRQIAGRRDTGRVVRGEDEWMVLIEDVLPAYISVAQYRSNLARLAANAARADARGAVRPGAALLSGLVHCGRCGTRMSVRYHPGAGNRSREYVCCRGQVLYGDATRCQAVNGPCVEERVVVWVLEALAPAAVEVALHAAGQVEAERAELEKLWTQRLERAAITADRARRCYHLAEPENRLVVRQLEREWELALATQRNLGEEHDRFLLARPLRLTGAERRAVEELAANVPALWHADQTTDADRKEIIRAVVDRVEMTLDGVSERVQVTVRWAGGQVTTGQVVRPVASLAQLSDYPRLAARVRELAGQGLMPAAVAECLNAEGFHPAQPGDCFGRQGVADLMRRLRCHPAPRRARPAACLGPDEWPVADLAAELDMPTRTLKMWIERGWATGRQETEPPHRWIARADPVERQRLCDLRARPHPRPEPGDLAANNQYPPSH